MAVYKKVAYQWHHDPSNEYVATVSIDGEWNGLEDDDGIFFYFASQREYGAAKKQDNDFDFWIVGEYHN